MNNIQYLAACAHFFGAFSVIVTMALFSKRWTPFIIILIVGTVCAGIKEFWYDMNYELPPQLFLDSSEDFIFYILGGYLGLIPVYLRNRKEST